MDAPPFAPGPPLLRLGETIKSLIAVIARLLSRPERPVAAAPIGGVEVGSAAFGRLLAIAHTAGIEAERARIAAIMSSAGAASNLAFAWRLAATGELTLEQAERAFAAVLADAQASSVPTDETAPAGAMLH